MRCAAGRIAARELALILGEFFRAQFNLAFVVVAHKVNLGHVAFRNHGLDFRPFYFFRR